jgi:hypothetical protein
MGSLKVAVGFVLRATPVAPFAGVVELTVGRVVSRVVPALKVQTKLLAKALPAKSLTPVVIVAVYRTPAARLLAGVKVAVVLVEATVPMTGVSGVSVVVLAEATVPVRGVVLCSVKVAVVMVSRLIASLKVAVTFVLSATPVAPFAGLTKVTVGRVVSGVSWPLFGATPS